MTSPEPLDPFAWALQIILDLEGGYVNDPADHGGETNLGITAATLAEAQADDPTLPTSVRDLTPALAGRIYRRRYWDAINGDRLAQVSPRMTLCVFDAAVQSSPRRAARQFQRVVQAEQDGVIGKVTISCYRIRRMTYSDEVLLDNFMDLRRRFYQAIVFGDPTQRKFAAGWRRRRNVIRTAVGLEPEDA